MQLAQFIEQALGFFKRTESKIAESDTLKTKVSDLEKDVAGKAARIAELEGQVAELQKSGTAQETKINELTVALDTEKKRAVQTLAAQGIDAANLPPAGNDAGAAAKPKENAWQKYCHLQATNPRAAGEFYREHAAEILADRSKSA